MINKVYLGINSPEFQKCWKKDDLLIVNVMRVAYAFFTHNLSVFFQHQRDFVKKLFHLDVSSQEVKVSPPIPDKGMVSLVSAIPFAGIALGMLGGIMNRCIQGVPSDFKYESCRAATPHMVLPGLNRLKQLELKFFSLFSATVPLTYNFIQAVRKEPKDLPFVERVTHAVKKQICSKEFVFTSVLMALSLSNAMYSPSLRLTQKGGFDSSGHAMMKTVLAAVMASAVGNTFPSTPYLGTAFTVAYAATDAIFLYNAARFCHTVAETGAGVLWGMGIIALGTSATYS